MAGRDQAQAGIVKGRGPPLLIKGFRRVVQSALAEKQALSSVSLPQSYTVRTPPTASGDSVISGAGAGTTAGAGSRSRPPAELLAAYQQAGWRPVSSRAGQAIVAVIHTSSEAAAVAGALLFAIGRACKHEATVRGEQSQGQKEESLRRVSLCSRVHAAVRSCQDILCTGTLSSSFSHGDALNASHAVPFVGFAHAAAECLAGYQRLNASVANRNVAPMAEHVWNPGRVLELALTAGSRHRDSSKALVPSGAAFAVKAAVGDAAVRLCREWASCGAIPFSVCRSLVLAKCAPIVCRATSAHSGGGSAGVLAVEARGMVACSTRLQ